MLEGLNEIPWSELEHAYGTDEDVPDLLRALLDPDPKVRKSVLFELYGNVFHQGTRYPATPYVVPFLIELCANPEVPERGELLQYWGDLIAGYFNVRERPLWGDGERIYWGDEPVEIDDVDPDDPYTHALHEIYQASLKGYDLLLELLRDEDCGVRAGAAWLLACLPTRKTSSVPVLEHRLAEEPVEAVRVAMTFALGELGASETLRSILAAHPAPAVQCMAVCELARLAPGAELIDTMLPLLATPIEGYEQLRGAGGPSTGDVAYTITQLPVEVRPQAIPALGVLLDRARVNDTLPLVLALLSAAFTPSSEPLTHLTELQKEVLGRMTHTKPLWRHGNLMDVFPAYGLPFNRDACKALIATADPRG